MHYFPYIILLASLSGLSLLILGMLSLLDFIQATSKQKILMIKVGLLIIGISPFIFYFIRLFSLPVINIPFSNTLANQLASNSIYIDSFKSRIDWQFYLLLIYCVGFLMMIYRIASSYWYTKKLLSKSIPLVIHGQTIFINKHIQSPLSFGFPAAKIYFPFNVNEKLTSREVQISLAHEKIHLEHKDSLWKLISLLIEAVLFFAPWSYVLHKKLELEMEILCDEISCIRARASSKEYGALLLAMVCHHPGNLIVSNLSNSNLKRRFTAMKSKKRPCAIFTAILTTILLLADTAAIATTSGISLQKTAFDVFTQIYVDGELISSPHILAKDGQTATIYISDKMNTTNGKIKMTGKSLKIDLIASSESDSNSDIKLNYEISYKNGNDNMHCKRRFVVLPKQNAAMKWTESGHTYELRVLAEKV